MTDVRRVSESFRLLLRDRRRDSERGDTGASSATASAVAYCAAASAIALSRALSIDRKSFADELLPRVRRR